MNINIDGLDIEYIEQGTGIPVLLLHGWGSSYDVYKGIINTLSNRCRVVAVNFPGCGNSQTMENPWTLDDYCDFVLKFMKAVNLENPIMFGHSHGGRVTLKMVASKMVNPQKIVLLDSAGLIPKKSFKQRFRAFSFKTIKYVLTLPVIKNYSYSLINFESIVSISDKVFILKIRVLIKELFFKPLRYQAICFRDSLIPIFSPSVFVSSLTCSKHCSIFS